MHANGIITYAQTGKLLPSAEKQAPVEGEVSYHIGVLKREFEAGLID